MIIKFNPHDENEKLCSIILDHYFYSDCKIIVGDSNEKKLPDMFFEDYSIGIEIVSSDSNLYNDYDAQLEKHSKQNFDINYNPSSSKKFNSFVYTLSDGRICKKPTTKSEWINSDEPIDLLVEMTIKKLKKLNNIAIQAAKMYIYV